MDSPQPAAPAHPIPSSDRGRDENSFVEASGIKPVFPDAASSQPTQPMASLAPAPMTDAPAPMPNYTAPVAWSSPSSPTPTAGRGLSTKGIILWMIGGAGLLLILFAICGVGLWFFLSSDGAHQTQTVDVKTPGDDESLPQTPPSGSQEADSAPQQSNSAPTPSQPQETGSAPQRGNSAPAHENIESKLLREEYENWRKSRRPEDGQDPQYSWLLGSLSFCRALLPDFLSVTEQEENALSAGKSIRDARAFLRLAEYLSSNFGAKFPPYLLEPFQPSDSRNPTAVQTELARQMLQAACRWFMMRALDQVGPDEASMRRVEQIEKELLQEAAAVSPTRTDSKPIQLTPQHQLLRNNLGRVGKAVHDFNRDHKKLPSFVVVDTKGRLRDPQLKPTEPFSWRVHILPYLGYRSLHQRFRLNERWDSPHNRKLINSIPDVYRTPGVTAPGQTGLRVFNSMGTPINSNLNEVPIPSSVLWAVVVGKEKAIEWTKPEGLPFDIPSGVGQLGQPPMPEGFPIVLLDGKAAILSTRISINHFNALAKADVRMDMPPGTFQYFPEDQDITAAQKSVKQNYEELKKRLQAAAKDEPAVKMRKMVAAIQYCGSAAGSFPTASSGVRYDQKGFSWRVWILPFFRGPALKQLYEQFKFDQPWDSPHNLRIAQHMPDVYKTPDCEQRGETTFHVFSCKGAPFHESEDIRHVGDGTQYTVAVVRGAAKTAAPWTRPGGLSFDPRQSLPEQLGPPTDDHGYLFAFFDLDVYRFPSDEPPERVWLMIQHRDGQSGRLRNYIPPSEKE